MSTAIPAHWIQSVSVTRKTAVPAWRAKVMIRIHGRTGKRLDLHFYVQTNLARREPKKLRINRVVCHLPDYCHHTAGGLRVSPLPSLCKYVICAHPCRTCSLELRMHN